MWTQQRHLRGCCGFLVWRGGLGLVAYSGSDPGGGWPTGTSPLLVVTSRYRGGAQRVLRPRATLSAGNELSTATSSAFYWLRAAVFVLLAVTCGIHCKMKGVMIIFQT